MAYFEDKAGKLKGHFDLRNVQGIKPAVGTLKPKDAVAAGRGAVMLKIAEESKGGVRKSDKVMVVSFKDTGYDEEGERDAWILVFPGSEETELESPGGTAVLSEALYGQVKVGKGTADVADGISLHLPPSTKCMHPPPYHI